MRLIRVEEFKYRPIDSVQSVALVEWSGAQLELQFVEAYSSFINIHYSNKEEAIEILDWLTAALTSSYPIVDLFELIKHKHFDGNSWE